MGTRRHFVSKLLMLLFCAIIATCVTIVMLCFYHPNQNNLQALSSVCMDIVCIIILFILLISFAYDNYGVNKTTKQYAGLLTATIWALFLDLLNWVFDGSLTFWKATYWFTVGSLCMGSILVLLFCWYLCSYLEENHGLKNMRLRAKICSGVSIVSFVLTFTMAMTGTAFQFVDGHYEIGALYDVVTVIPILTMFYLTGLVIRHVRKIGFHDVIAVTGYILFMVGGALIESTYSIGTTYVAVSIANIFIFVMLQNEVIAKEKRKTQHWMQKSQTDELTGLANRYAYEKDISGLQEEDVDDDLTYVSVDVNSLKATNDSLGHMAGDELILGAAQCLEKCLGIYGKIYRMGGDEFIGLIYVSADELDTLGQQIEEATKQWSGKLVQKLSISCGFAAKREDTEMSIRELAILADKRMYEAKSNYYRTFGIDRRKR